MTFSAYSCSDGTHRMPIDPATRAIVSWSAPYPVDLDLRVQIADGRYSEWLPYVRTNPWRSCPSADAIVRLAVDVLETELSAIAIEVRTQGVDGLFVATPAPPPLMSPTARALTRVAVPTELTLPAMSQYVGEERGWCAAASLAMVLNYWARRTGDYGLISDVARVAESIYDHAYGGTGNWTFGTAYANMRGLRAAVAYLGDLDRAERFILADLPLILSICWGEGELEGAPLPTSDGHLLVLRGFDREGYALVNDPALPGVRGRYRRAELEAAWQRAGGVCYAIAPRSEARLLPLLMKVP